jgi:hypothetical protein
VAVVKKYRHWLSAYCGGDDQINTVISIHVPRLDQEAAYWAINGNRLSSNLGKVYLNRVVGTAAPVLSGLNAGEIWEAVAVEICDCKAQTGSKRSSRRILCICLRHSCAEHNAKKQRQNYKSKQQVRSAGPSALIARPHCGCAPCLDESGFCGAGLDCGFGCVFGFGCGAGFDCGFGCGVGLGCGFVPGFGCGFG